VATLLLAGQDRLRRALRIGQRGEPALGQGDPRWLPIPVFLVSAYGGYFGAGLGIVLLAVMALTLPFDIYELQGIRSVLGTLINAVAAIVFIVRGHLALDAVYALLAGSLIGGWLGTTLVRRVSPKVVRTLVILVGAGTTIRLALSA
jgi:uncharacterized membrane protein YfcA